jgi:predicted DNA-binding transcriptional regulator AlpA
MVVERLNCNFAQQPTGKERRSVMTENIQTQFTSRRSTYERTIETFQLLTAREVCKACRISSTTLWRWSGDPNRDFPKSIRMSPKAVRWYENEILAWLEKRGERAK